MILEDYVQEEALIAERKERRFRKVCAEVIRPPGTSVAAPAPTITLPNECPYCGDLKHPCQCYGFGGI